MKRLQNILVALLLLCGTWSCTNNVGAKIETLWQKVCTSATQADEVKNVNALSKYMMQKHISFSFEATSVSTGTVYNLPYTNGVAIPTNDTLELRLIVSAAANKKIKSDIVWKPHDEESIYIFFRE